MLEKKLEHLQVQLMGLVPKLMGFLTKPTIRRRFIRSAFRLNRLSSLAGKLKKKVKRERDD